MDKNGTLVRRIVGLYVANTPGYLKRLAQTVASGSADEIAGAAHAIKSMSLTIGAQQVANLAGGLEQDARAIEIARKDARLDAMEAALASAIAALEDVAAAGHPPSEDADRAA